MEQLKGRIVLGVCGSVAVVETPKLVRELRRMGFDVECVMSYNAQKMLHPQVLEWASGHKVVTEITGAVEHVRLCGVEGEGDLLLICPATSNTISKIASGIDDTPVTTFAVTALGSGMKTLIAPAMHYSMYSNPFVALNIKRLKEAGVIFIDPRLEDGKAKLATVDEVTAKVVEVFSSFKSKSKNRSLGR